MKGFFKVKTPEEIYTIFSEFPAVATEEIRLTEAVGRISAEPIISPEDIPPFNRSTMDGYAVRARDTFGSSESMPGLLTVVGKVKMGEFTSLPLSNGQTCEIMTGGMLPPQADAIVMQEYAQQVDATTIEIMKTVAPGEHVIQRGEDLKKGEQILPEGHRLRPQDIGVLAAIGRQKIMVYQKPRVAIISTGDEIVPIEQTPPPGKIRNINTYTLRAAVQENGGIPVDLGIVPDSQEYLRAKCAEGLEKADVILVSGGSSVGIRDFTASVFESFPDSQILVHGASISPGKPIILARVGKQSLWGLPGHPASSMIVFWLFVRPLLQHIGGLAPQITTQPHTIKARLSRNVPSAQGREDYVRVRISQYEGTYIADPIFGKSGLISTLAKAQGMIRIDMNTEGLDKDSLVDVYLF